MQPVPAGLWKNLKNSKFQITNKFQITMTKITNPSSDRILGFPITPSRRMNKELICDPAICHGQIVCNL
jgi:hypothetical protein